MPPVFVWKKVEKPEKKVENLFIRSVKIKENLPDDEYYSNLAVIRGIKKRELKFESPVTFFVSENGMGKSTLTEAIAISLGFNAEGER